LRSFSRHFITIQSEIAAERGGKLCGVRVAALCRRREFVAVECFHPRRGPRWIDLANNAPDFIHARLRQVVVSIGVRPVSNS
jgi:hypothetical protein